MNKECFDEQFDRYILQTDSLPEYNDKDLEDLFEQEKLDEME